MASCRDCTRCTEKGIVTILKLPFRFVLFFPRLITYRFRKLCPACRHPLSMHQRRKDGTFKD